MWLLMVVPPGRSLVFFVSPPRKRKIGALSATRSDDPEELLTGPDNFVRSGYFSSWRERSKKQHMLGLYNIQKEGRGKKKEMGKVTSFFPKLDSQSH